MSANKNAQLRYRILDTCFRNNRRQFTIDDLVDEVNVKLNDIYGISVSLRQIREDIKFMRDSVGYDAPIEAYPFDGRRCYYRYSDPDFSIFTSELSSEEVKKLGEAVGILSRFRGMPSFEWVEQVVSDLEYRFGGKPNKENVVSFDQNERLRGLEHLSPLVDAAVNHQALKILYRSFKGIEQNVTVFPYHLKQYNGRWFLLGLKEGSMLPSVSTFALDRIEKIEFSDAAFVPNTEIDFSSYFKDIVGVTHMGKKDASPERVKLRFSKERFPYVVSKPMHQSQTILSETECTVQLEVYPNPELTSLVCSFLPDVEVLEPHWLRDSIRMKLEENLKKYNL